MSFFQKAKLGENKHFLIDRQGMGNVAKYYLRPISPLGLKNKLRDCAAMSIENNQL